jgi:hypothetical protein
MDKGQHWRFEEMKKPPGGGFGFATSASRRLVS